MVDPSVEDQQTVEESSGDKWPSQPPQTENMADIPPCVPAPSTLEEDSDSHLQSFFEEQTEFGPECDYRPEGHASLQARSTVPQGYSFEELEAEIKLEIERYSARHCSICTPSVTIPAFAMQDAAPCHRESS